MTQRQSSSAVRVLPGAPIRADLLVLEVDSDQVRSPVVRIFVRTKNGLGGSGGLERAACWVAQPCNGRRQALQWTADQVYLSDSAELFDLPLDAHALLGPAAGDHSALLIDCAKLAEACHEHPDQQHQARADPLGRRTLFRPPRRRQVTAHRSPGRRLDSRKHDVGRGRRHLGDSFDTQHGKAPENEDRGVERVCASVGFGAKK